MPSINADQFDSNAQGIDYLARARELAPTLTAAADEIERRRDLPDAVVAAPGERGRYHMEAPSCCRPISSR